MSLTELLGWCAASLVLACFYLKTMVSLRLVAIASNITFAGYGLLSDATPVFVLHCLLLPLNLVRLWQMRDLLRRVRRASGGQLAFEALLPHMRPRILPAGTRLFARGDHADTMFLVLKGRVRIVGAGLLSTPGQLVGAIGLFSPEQRRLDTAVCETAVEVAVMDEDTVWELVYRNPAFGACLLRLVVERSVKRLDQAGAQYPRRAA